jgi:DNA-binding response OmpR family regulator
MPGVLIIDDDVELTALLKEYLEQEEFTVTIAHDGETGIGEALSGRHAIVVLDVMMPGVSGMDVLRGIRASSQLPVLMLTARGEDTDCVVGLELGADDYVPKPCTSRQLVARIRAILRRGQGEHAASDQPITIGLLTLWPQKRKAHWDAREIELTSTEFSLLEILARNAGRPVHKQELSEQGLGRALARFDRNVDMHLSRLRRKLGTLSDGRSCIQTVYRLGYQLVKE